MIYSNIYLKNKFQVPSIIVLLVIFFIIIFLNLFFSKSLIPARATNDTIKRVEIVNLSPTQAGVYWQTDKKVTSWIIFGEKESNLKTIVYDERDFQDTHFINYNHYVILRDLKESAIYFFKIVSDNKLVSNKIYQISTPSNIINNNNIKPAYGKIIQVDGLGLENAIVIISANNTYSLATLTKLTGEWLIPLNYLYNKSDLKLYTVTINTPIKIEIISPNNDYSTVITNVEKAAPIPQTLIIGKNYNFSDNNVLAAKSNLSKDLLKTFDIIFPKENAIVPAKSPLIKGLAQPFTDVIVTIKANKSFSTRVRSDKDSIWRVILTENLNPGSYIISAISKDNNGKESKIERKFTVVKSGEQVMGEATGEPTLTLSPSPTSALTATETPITYPSPTEIQVTSQLSPTEPISGSNFNKLMIGSTSLVIIGLGLLLAF